MNFSLIWQTDDGVLATNQLPFGVAFPARTTEAFAAQLRSNARDLRTTDTLTAVRFYLSGSYAVQVVEQWPQYGQAFTPERTDLNGGFEVSFDDGATWIRFDLSHGWQGDPSTWIPLPASALGSNGIAGTIGPLDIAHLLVRLVVPPGAGDFTTLDLRLVADCDVV